MTHSDWLWRTAFYWLLLVILLCGVDGRRYDKCSTPDGRQGVCVVKRYCREPGRLVPCDDDGDYCCPIPTSHRSAPQPPVATTTPETHGGQRERFGGRPQEKATSEHRDDTERSPKPKSESRIRKNSNQTIRRRPPKRPPYDDDPKDTRTTPQVPRVPGCGVKPYELFIAGGETAEAHEWPWMAAIFRRHQSSRPKTFLCGGSLINTKYILTAAHCFVNNYVILPASSFVVRLGSHFLNSGEEYTVSQLILHHNHSGSDFFNDIALVRLAGQASVTDKVAPICLPTPQMAGEDLVNRVATVAGWGDTTFRSGASRALQHVSVPIVSSEECFAAYSRVRGAAFLARGSDHVVCAGLREGGKDACLGDSGGPLMLSNGDRWVIVGIVSLGYKCAEPGYPGVYTRVTHYMSWIQANMKRY